MSVSQYKSFMNCEAAALAELKGEYSPVDKLALVAGKYLHSWSEGTLEKFKLDNYSTIYNKKGEPYAEFKKIDDMIKTLENDDYCMTFLQGQKEVIMTAEFAGTIWKIKIDVLNQDQGFFSDLKSTRSIRELQWSEKWRHRVSFIEEYDYMIQAVVYAEIESIYTGRGQWLNPMMVAVSKENPPDKAVISLMDENRLGLELDRIEGNMPHILAVKSGNEQPKRCEVCEYCRMTKKVNRFINYMELGGDIYSPKGA